MYEISFVLSNLIELSFILLYVLGVPIWYLGIGSSSTHSKIYLDATSAIDNHISVIFPCNVTGCEQ